MDKRQRLFLGLLVILIIPVLAVSGGTIGFWLQLSPTDKTYLLSLIDHNKIYIFFSILIFIAILGYIAKWMLFSYFIPLQKMAEDAEILRSSDQLYTIETKGGREFKKLAAVLSRDAYELKELKNEIDVKIANARNDLEEEKNILASLVSELNDGIIICNNDGQIVLFNHHALMLFRESNNSDDTFQSQIGIGRSIYKVLPMEIIKHALNEIEYKIAQGDKNTFSQFVYSLPAMISARIRLIPVLQNEKNIGFIIILHDISNELEKDFKRYEMMESLVNTMRSSVGSIRAAIETVTGYRDMPDEQRDRFHSIIVDEASRITNHLNDTISKYKDYFNLNWPLEQIQGKSLLNLVKQNLKYVDKFKVSFDNCPDEIWIAVENFSFVNLIRFLILQVNSATDITDFRLQLWEENKFINLDINWDGKETVNLPMEEWLNKPVAIHQTVLPYTVDEVVQRHNARIWYNQNSSGTNSIRILLRSVKILPPSEKIKKVTYGARPEFYDFDLFSHSILTDKFEDVPLSKLKYVVFDAETTGLNPSGGDEIISLGAVRIVNGKMLSEQYEQLVDPGRKINKMTTAITGITPEILQGKPGIDQVLPVFHSYCDDAILVAHNAAFDMRFLQLKEKQLGLKFENPVLDTLLLSASVHVNQESHSLDAIAERFGLTIKGRHTALGDALVTAEILLKLIPILEEKGIITLEQALKASQKTYYARIKY